MDFFEDVITWLVRFWYATLPLSLFIIYIIICSIYIIITELLDLIFNTRRINKMLKYSDNLNITSLEREFEFHKASQLSLDSSNLKEIKRQVEYFRLQTKRAERGWGYQSNSFDNKKIISAKILSDIFRFN